MPQRQFSSARLNQRATLRYRTTDLKRGETSVELKLKSFPASDFFVVLEALKPYFQALGALRPGYRGLIASGAAASAPPVDRYAGAFRLKFGG